MNPHPNATVAGGTTVVAAFVLWAAGAVGANIPDWIAVAVAGGVTSAVLFVGRTGIRGTWRRIEDGQEKPPPKS